MDGQEIAPPPPYEEVVSTTTAAYPTAEFESKPHKPPQGGVYAPQQGAYAPEGDTYAPPGDAYAPQGGTYAPQGGAYAPQGGAYAPQGGAYAPQGGTYAPQGGAYAPQGGYTVQAEAYQQLGGGVQTEYTQQIIRTEGNAAPPDHTMLAVIVTFCCCMPFGIIGIIKANEAKHRWQVGDGVGAHQSAAEARRWSIIGIITGVFLMTVLVAVLVVVLAI